MGDKSSPSVTSWSEFEARAATDLDALPEAVRAIVEEYRAEQAAAAAATKPTLAEDGRELPYTCRMYESIPGEEELLQLQWMRLDVRVSWLPTCTRGHVTLSVFDPECGKYPHGYV